MKKKGLTVLALVVGIWALTGCGGGNAQEPPEPIGLGGLESEISPDDRLEESEQNQEAEGAGGSEKAPAKGQSLTIMTDGSVFSTVYESERFLESLEARTGTALEIITCSEDTYYETVEETFLGTQWPDIVLLDASHYAEYACRGALWDMTESYQRSFWRSRLTNSAVPEGWKIDGKLYGFAPFSGNGLVTYVKKEWLDNCSLEVPDNFMEFLQVCQAFTNGDPDGNGIEGDTYAVTGLGLVSDEAPYTEFLPQFYQDAYPGFYQDEDGIWRDGFAEEAMEKALWRLKMSYLAGYIDKDILENDEVACYDKFVRGKYGIYTGRAGTYASELKAGLEARGYAGELVALPPIAEQPAYPQAGPRLWCITTACREPQKAFLFLSSMMDGRDGEFLWTYGMEDIHWTMEAEEVNGRVYAQGEFHGLRDLSRPGAYFSSLYIDPFFALVPLNASTISDPLVNMGEEARNSAIVMKWYGKPVQLLPFTDEIGLYYDELEALKKRIILDVVTGDRKAEEALEQYRSGEGARLAGRILDSLNGSGIG